MKSQSSKLALSLQRDALRFAEADADGNMDLSFEEFVNMQPHKVRETHGEAVLREWFDAADTDHSGTVSINEFLIWSLAKEQARSGDDSGLRAMFSVYDKDGSGTVDSREFAKICDDIGFGSAASDIFQDLDKDGSGMVNYHELLDLLGAAAAAPPATGKGGKAAADGGVAGTQTKLFLMAAAWHDHDQDSAAEIAQSFDTSGWKYDAKDATGLANQLRANLKSTQLSIADLIELFNYSETRDGKGGSVGSSRADTSYFSISAEEFVRAMRERFGFSGDDGLLREVFGSINRNNDGALEPSELFEFIEQRTLQLRRSEADAEETEKMLKSLHLKPVYPHPEGKAWSSEDLRSELQACLAKHNVAPHWLIEHWDGDDSGVLSSREFLSKAKKLFVDDEASNKLWYESVRGTVISTFDVLAGADRQLDVVEFEQWQAKRAFETSSQPTLKAPDSPPTVHSPPSPHSTHFYLQVLIVHRPHRPHTRRSTLVAMPRWSAAGCGTSPSPSPLPARRSSMNTTIARTEPPNSPSSGAAGTERGHPRLASGWRRSASLSLGARTCRCGTTKRRLRGPAGSRPRSATPAKGQGYGSWSRRRRCTRGRSRRAAPPTLLCPSPPRRAPPRLASSRPSAGATRRSSRWTCSKRWPRGSAWSRGHRSRRISA